MVSLKTLGEKTVSRSAVISKKSSEILRTSTKEAFDQNKKKKEGEGKVYITDTERTAPGRECPRLF